MKKLEARLGSYQPPHGLEHIQERTRYVAPLYIAHRSAASSLPNFGQGLKPARRFCKPSKIGKRPRLPPSVPNGRRSAENWSGKISPRKICGGSCNWPVSMKRKPWPKPKYLFRNHATPCVGIFPSRPGTASCSIKQNRETKPPWPSCVPALKPWHRSKKTCQQKTGHSMAWSSRRELNRQPKNAPYWSKTASAPGGKTVFNLCWHGAGCQRLPAPC
ncbi:MAG: hypothetical protein DESF_01836 [Desulfovibrio sp.]